VSLVDTSTPNPVITNPPPSNTQQPGFVVPPMPGTPAVTPVEPTPAAPATPDLSAAIAALTAAMAANKPQEPAAPATTAAADSLNSYDIGAIEDPIIKSMATVLSTVGQGLDMDRAIGKALADGRADLIDVAYLREKGGANADQLITIATGIVNAVEAKANQVTSELHALAGGEPLWNASVASFNKGAPQELRIVVAQMLDSQKDNLIKAGAKMIVEYGKSSGTVPQANPLIAGGASALPQAQALSKEAFQVELRKLNPQSREFAADRNALFSRRQLGRQLGM